MLDGDEAVIIIYFQLIVQIICDGSFGSTSKALAAGFAKR